MKVSTGWGNGGKLLQISFSRVVFYPQPQLLNIMFSFIRFVAIFGAISEKTVEFRSNFNWLFCCRVLLNDFSSSNPTLKWKKGVKFKSEHLRPYQILHLGTPLHTHVHAECNFTQKYRNRSTPKNGSQQSWNAVLCHIIAQIYRATINILPTKSVFSTLFFCITPEPEEWKDICSEKERRR